MTTTPHPRPTIQTLESALAEALADIRAKRAADRAALADIEARRLIDSARVTAA